MGTFCIPRSNLINSSRKVKDIYEELFENKESENLHIEKYSVIGNVVYAGVVSKIDPSHTFVEITRFSITKDEVCYKSFGEHNGKSLLDCPERILKYASKTDENSVKWVEHCREHRREKTRLNDMRNSVKVGDEIRIDRIESTSTYIVKSFWDQKTLMVEEINGDNDGSVALYRVMEII